MRIRRPTEMLRATVSQEIRVILEPETGAQAHPQLGRPTRTVQLLVPDSPRMSADIDKLPHELGLNREYKMPTMPPGQAIVFTLLAEQRLVAVANDRFVEATLIIEYGWENG